MALERPRFSTTKIREGYEIEDVDAAVDRILVALSEPAASMSPADVSSLRFAPVRLREGYDMGEVDSWLDLAAAELGRAADGAAPAAFTAPAPAAPPTPGTTAHETAASARSDAITEVRSGSSRVLAVLALVVLAAAVAYLYYA